MRLKSKNDFPPNGWAFFQAETGWKPTPYMSFQDTVMEIAAHRRANPRFNLPTDTASVSYDLEQYTVARLLSIPDGNRFLLMDDNPAPPVFKDRLPLRQRMAGAVADAKRNVAGISVMINWLGEGLRPVDQDTAEVRAYTCAGCKFNVRGGEIKEVAGDILLRLIEVKNQMNLKTARDEELGECSICTCRLPVKVWANIKHIVANQDKEVANSLPEWCWIKTQDGKSA